MKTYAFSEKDPSSDIGYWTVVILAKSLPEARAVLKMLLEAAGRKLNNPKIKPDQCSPVADGYTVVYNDIENR